ncbi:MAG TPA: nuclear transport factor 2 family protein [Solirubrobacteraceae bacterium]|nr:nuclear transport factor 2 family protein [Solirubrobacteraceae bacterium]
MSAENVELVRSVYPDPEVDVAALITDDEAAAQWIQAVAPRFDPSLEGTIRLPGLGAPVIFRELQGLRDVWRGWLGHWTSFHVEIEEVIDGGERILTVDRAHGRHRPEEPEDTLRRTVIWTVRDGRIVSVDFNVPHAEALATVGDAAR